MSHILGIIPARYASSRFPGKPLALLDKKPMIQWVYEGSKPLFDHLLVATDDQRIFDAVEAFGGSVVMTSPDHASGTERCAEALQIIRNNTGIMFDHVVNIQGDEPLVNIDQLKMLLYTISSAGTAITTLIRPVNDRSEIDNPNVVKVVVDKTFKALYFSRAPIPYLSEQAGGNTMARSGFYVHVGMYAYRSDVLEALVMLPPSPLERTESLEQLRWMEHGYPVQTCITNSPSLGVDTPEDLEKLRSRI